MSKWALTLCSLILFMGVTWHNTGHCQKFIALVVFLCSWSYILKSQLIKFQDKNRFICIGLCINKIVNNFSLTMKNSWISQPVPNKNSDLVLKISLMVTTYVGSKCVCARILCNSVPSKFMANQQVPKFSWNNCAQSSKKTFMCPNFCTNAVLKHTKCHSLFPLICWVF